MTPIIPICPLSPAGTTESNKVKIKHQPQSVWAPLSKGEENGERPLQINEEIPQDDQQDGVGVEAPAQNKEEDLR